MQMFLSSNADKMLIIFITSGPNVPGSCVNSHHHRVVAIDAYSRRLDHDTPSPSLKQFPSYLRANAPVTSCEQQVEQRLSLVLSDIVSVSLRKGKQALMPDDRQFACVAEVASHRLGVHGICTAVTHAAEAQEVEDERVDDLEGEGVLLLEKGLDEDVAGAGGIGVG